jgi:hypothetical protein
MERAFSKVGRDRLDPRALNGGIPLRGRDTYTDSVKAFLGVMIESDETPNMKRALPPWE